jgi:arylsulfatase A-like enzyme
LAVALEAAGYHTALMGKYFNEYGALDPVPPGWDTWHATVGYWPEGRQGPYGTDLLRDLAVETITGKDGPVFLWFAPFAPHSPASYAPRHADAFPDASGADRDRLRSLLAVDEAVVAIDEALGANRAAQAVWFVLSDNGFRLGGGRADKAVPHDGAVRVPMLARVPGVGGGQDARLVANIDVAPTIARAVDIALPTAPDGRALQDAWQRERILLEGWDTEGTPMAPSPRCGPGARPTSSARDSAPSCGSGAPPARSKRCASTARRSNGRPGSRICVAVRGPRAGTPTAAGRPITI